MTYRNPKLLTLAEGKHCMNCGAQDQTVVAAHSNLQEHGRGHAHPAHDCFHAWLCWRCHSWLEADKSEMFRRAMDRTQRYQWENQMIEVAK
jgi:hypothetical protein